MKGKSTLVNYLIGHKIQFGRRHDEPYAFVDQNNDENDYAKIGHSICQSETLFPEGFVDKTCKIIFCDCPGFLENRGLEEKIAVTVNLELAIRNSSQVKAIIIAVGYHELFATRGDSFKKLYKILDNLVKDIEKVRSQIIFVITRSKPDLKPDAFLSYIDEHLKSNSDSLTELGKKLKSLMQTDKVKEKSIKEKERTVKILNLIKDNSKNIVIGDLSNNDCRNKIFSLINSSINPIPKDMFCFDSYDDNHIMFIKFINEIIYESLKNLRRLFSKPGEIAKIEIEIDDCNSKIEFYRSRIEKIKSNNNGNLVENDEKEIENYKKICSKNKKELETIEDKLKENQAKIKKYNDELVDLNSEEKFLIKEWKYFEKRMRIFGIVGKSSKIFTYNNSMTPILDVTKTCENGKFFSKYFY